MIAKYDEVLPSDFAMEIGPGRNFLDFDLQNAGALTVSLSDEGGSYDGPLIASIVGPQGGVFHTSWEHGPYCFPVLDAGAFQFKDVRAPGRTVDFGVDPRFRVESGAQTRLQLKCSVTSTNGR